MGMVARVGAALQQVFGPLADQANRETQVVQRQRMLTPLSLARTFVLGFLQKPNASDEELARVAAQCGTPVTPQAIDQRHTPRLVAFLERLFRHAVRVVVGSEQALAPILDRFPAVVVLDSTTLGLPDDQRERFRGCGGRSGSGQAALKLQTELDLRSGALSHVEIESGRSADSATSRQQAVRGPGVLRITDLGYFSLAVFAAMQAVGEHFLSRLQYGVSVTGSAGPVGAVRTWLARQVGPWVDQEVQLGQDQSLTCRLVAWRVPPTVAAERRRKVRAAMRRKWGREPTAERLAWCDWTILVTSVPGARLTPAEAAVLYRARWQIELLFKRWKSQNRVAELSGSTPVRQLVRVWARLLAAVVQHWLVVASVAGDPTRSWDKVAEAVRGFVGRLVVSLSSPEELATVMADLLAVVATTCRRNRRRKPGTLELLNNVELLDFVLT